MTFAIIRRDKPIGEGRSVKGLCNALLLLVGLLMAPAALGQNLNLVWPEWEASAVPKRGPEKAGGLLVYFHGRGITDSTRLPILGLFLEMAKVAKWDVLRINRLVFADLEDGAEDILQIVSEEVERARKDGYRKIIVAGGSRGGWLALVAATLPGVDAAIGLAPGTGTHEPADLARTRDLLTEKLAGAKAPRVAVFFFEGDLGVADGRAASIRGGLQRSGSAFLVVDQPTDLHGHDAMDEGRFIRRYRDCLLNFILDENVQAGEVQCSRATGYAVGADIGFPTADVPPRPSQHANPRFLPYWGRWEGDDKWGAYFIMEAVYAGAGTITFRVGFSAPPDNYPSGPKTWIQYLTLSPDDTGQGLIFKVPGGSGEWAVKLTSALQLQLSIRSANERGVRVTYQVLLRRPAGEGAAP